MKIAAVATSQVPANYANSIQVMKTCSSLAELTDGLRLWVPGGTTNQDTGWDELASYYGIGNPFEICRVPTKTVLRRYDLAYSAVGEAERWGADILYTWMLQAGVLALWMGIPVILEMHDLPTGRLGPLLFRYFSRHKGKKRLLVITEALRSKLESLYKTPPNPGEIQVAPNGTDPAMHANLPSQEDLRRMLELPPGPIALYSGHFYAGRGMDLLFGLAKRLPGVSFLWIGGTFKSTVDWKQRLFESGIHNVILSGFIENSRLPLYQAAADVLLMPYEKAISGSSGGNSAEICSPMKMFDYMSAGRAIISSDLPVIHEILNENNAVFCPPGDIDAWQQAITTLMSKPELRHRLASRAKLDAEGYTWKGRAEKALQNFIT